MNSMVVRMPSRSRRVCAYEDLRIARSRDCLVCRIYSCKNTHWHRRRGLICYCSCLDPATWHLGLDEVEI
jgi:hypothetical protein